MDYRKLRTLLNETLSGKRDEPFKKVITSLHCMSRARLYATINAIVSSMDPGEFYYEVGMYQGGSLISALTNNSAQAIGVDNFGEFKETNNLALTQSHLEQFGVGDRAKLYNMDFRDYFRALDPATKIQVYYYDGAHDEETQLAGMEAAWPFLHSGSLVIVDDYTYPEVSRAVNRFVANHIGEVKFQLVFAAMESLDEHWWNGCVVLRVV